MMAAKKKTTKTPAGKKPAKPAATKARSKKASTNKPTAKKTVALKTPPKKAAGTRSPAKPATAKKTVALKTPPKKAAGTRSPAKAATAKAATAKKTVASKATNKKVATPGTAPPKTKKVALRRPRAIIVTPSSAESLRLGTKWICFSCDAKFYDLNRAEPLCPRCGADQRERPKATKASLAPARAKRKSRRAARPMAPLLEDEDDAVRYDEAFDMGIRGDEASDAAPAEAADDGLFSDPDDSSDDVDED